MRVTFMDHKQKWIVTDKIISTGIVFTHNEKIIFYTFFDACFKIELFSIRSYQHDAS